MNRTEFSELKQQSRAGSLGRLRWVWLLNQEPLAISGQLVADNLTHLSGAWSTKGLRHREGQLGSKHLVTGSRVPRASSEEPASPGLGLTLLLSTARGSGPAGPVSRGLRHKYYLSAEGLPSVVAVLQLYLLLT